MCRSFLTPYIDENGKPKYYGRFNQGVVTINLADIALSSAVKKEPLLDTWWGRLGYAREMAGNYYEAMEAYDEALRLNSSSIDASRGRERVSAKLQ